VQLLILKDRLDEATKLNDEIVKENAKDSDCLIYRGQIQLRRGQPREASTTLQSVVSTEPDNGVAHYHLGAAYDALGNETSAENEWRNAVRLRPDLFEAHHALAAIELKNSNYTALEASATEIIKLQPLLPDGYVLLGLSKQGRKDEKGAEADMRKAIEVAPQSPVGYIHVGNLLLEQKKFSESAKFYEQALTRDPTAADALVGLARVYSQQNQWDKAIARVNQQIAKVPNNSNYYYLLGVVYSDKEDYGAAETALRKAVDLDKTNSEALLKLGQVQVAAGHVDQAIATYQQSVKDNPADARFYVLAGEMLESKQQWQEAKDMYQKALQVQPDNALAKNNLAYLMLQQGGNVDIALAMAQDARRGMPDSPNSADTLGWALYQKGVYGSAVNLLKESIKNAAEQDQPEDPVTFYHLGLAYQKDGKKDLAKANLQKALKLNPKFAHAEEARQALAQL